MDCGIASGAGTLQHTSKPVRHWTSRLARFLTEASLVFGLAGCASVTPSASPAVSPTTSAVATSVTPAPIASPAVSAGPLTSLPPVPTGEWTGLNWIAIPDGQVPRSPVILLDPAHPLPYDNDVELFAWSRGYVDFIWDEGARTTVPWASSDGLHWQAGSKLDMSALVSQIPAWATRCALRVFQTGSGSGLVEGPAGLLVVGSLECAGTDPATASQGWTSTDTMWLSADGLSWSATGYRGAVVTALTGSSAGYLAVVSADRGNRIDQGVLTSTDGKTWHKMTHLPNGLIAYQPISVDALAGGFVMTASVTTKGSGSATGWEIAGAWWSADGLAWTRALLPDAFADASAYGSLYRLGDGKLLLYEGTADAQGGGFTFSVWTSGDGRTWKPCADTSTLVGPLGGFVVLAGGGHSLVLAFDYYRKEATSLATFDSDMNLVQLKQSQTGDVPPLNDSWFAVLGPRGLLATLDGSHFWIGVPTAS